MRIRAPFTLIRRTVKNKAKDTTRVIYYYRRPGDPVMRSTGQTNKVAARAWVEANVIARPKATPTLAAFAADFFRWDVCPWIARAHAQGQSFSRVMAVGRRCHLDRYILPAFGRRLLTDIKAASVSDLMLGLDLGNSTRNQVLSTFRIVMDEAVFRDLIEYNCVRTLKRFANDSRRRDVFDADELRRLFPEDPAKVWGDGYWHVFFFTMLCTGIRLGEARALRWQDLDESVPALAITRAVKADNGIGAPKSGRPRAVYVPGRAATLLRAWREASPWPGSEDLVFPGKDGSRTVSETRIRQAWAIALAAARIETAGRVLVIHSLRHTYNTCMRKLISETALQFMVGHSSSAMTDRYDQAQPLERLRALLPEREQIDRAWS